jgi:dCMP deaminase
MEEFSPKKKKKYIDFYMKIAKNVAEMSYANRLKVGSILVKDDVIISYGWNGMPAGWDNVCEDCEFVLGTEANLNSTKMIDLGYTLTFCGNWIRYKTRPEVIHSEANCLSKVAKSVISAKGSTMFLTHAPCIDCAKQIFTAGINKVYFRDHYRSTAGLDFLKKCNIAIEQCD